MKKILLIAFFLFPSIIFPKQSEPRILKDAHSLGMGGVGVSTFGYAFSPAANPAALGLMADHDIAPFFSIGADINPQSISLIQDAINLTDSSANFKDTTYSKLLDYATLSLNGPLNAGYMGKGFGIWTTSSSDLSIGFSNNPNGVVDQYGFNLDDLISFGFAVADHPNLDTITDQELLEIAKKEFGDDIRNSGLTDAEVLQLAQHVKNDPDKFVSDNIPIANFRNTFELALNIGYGYKIPFAALDDVSGLSFGATVRFSQRFKQHTEEGIVADALPDYLNNIGANTYHGSSISSDFGMSLRLQNWVLGVAVRDAVSTGYNWKPFAGSSSIPNTKIPYSVDFGTSYRFRFNNRFIQELGLYLEFVDTTSDVVSWANKVRAGTELKMFNFLDLRLGVYDSFVTTGLGMGWKWGRIDFAYYRRDYYNIFKRDQFYLNFTVGLDNSPKRKATALARQQSFDRAAVQAQKLLDNTLEGLYEYEAEAEYGYE